MRISFCARVCRSRAATCVLPATLCCLMLAPPTLAADKPNVLFIAVDDLNDWVHCLGGHPDARSPNIDRLAARGVLFTRAYCAAPACNPSRAALMTGVRPWTSGVYNNDQPWRQALRDVPTIPQHFRAHGYEAVGAGKIFHGSFEDPASWNDYALKRHDPEPSRQVSDDPRSKSGGIIWGALDADDGELSDYHTASYAIDYLAKPHEKPFFLACGIYRPHMPWQVPRKYYDLFPHDQLVLPAVPNDDLDDLPAAARSMARPRGDHATMLATGNWRYAVQAYLASIAFADAQIGRVLDAFDASRHRNNTIVVLWSDHGWHLGEKQHWRKFALWEEATRVPLVIIAPEITRPNSVCERTIDLMSIYPTLCELCGITTPPAAEGVNLAKLLRNPDAAWDRPAVTTHGRGNHAVRSERFRYIRYADGSEELYDHAADPSEFTNLSGKTQFDAMKQEMSRWLPKREASDAARAPARTDTRANVDSSQN